MRVRFWGTRGSIPVALTSAELRNKMAQALFKASGRTFNTLQDAHEFATKELDFSLTHTFGGHTPCVELETGSDEYFVCDLGSGARPFGVNVLAKQAGKPPVVNVFMSHVHWDHIMGFPFFGPAYVPGTKIRIHSSHEIVEHAFHLQQCAPCFPVLFEQLAADIEFIVVEPDKPFDVGGVKVTTHLQLHAGDSYGLRFEHNGRTVVYSTDSEYKLDNHQQVSEMTHFFRDADLLIFDAMYTFADAISVKADWGHSSNIVGVELAEQAKVKHLVLFHHEPANNDVALNRLLMETRRYEELTRGDHQLHISAAYDGLEIDI
jgi:phosphoribosyl 1,2-cyclic phosphodiesterase